MNSTHLYLGIDVAKESLEVAQRPAPPPAAPGHTTNDDQGISELVARLTKLRPALVVLEATAGIELPLVAALGAAELPIAVINPRQVRSFAKAIGKLAKTDTTDAQVLAQFAEAVRPEIRPLPQC